VSDRILLRSLVFEGRHGVSDAERAVPQPIEVDVALSLDLRAAGATDELERTVDYSAVARAVGQVIRSTSFQLIESIAEAIAADLLAAHPSVEEVEVRVHKPRIRLGEAGATAGREAGDTAARGASGTAAVEIRRGWLGEAR
jgi:dihydroneopterin aldolase